MCFTIPQLVPHGILKLPPKLHVAVESEMVLNDIDYKIRTLSYSPVDVSAAISFELFKETFGHLIGIFEYLLFPQR